MKLSDIPVTKEQITFSGVLKIILFTIWKEFKLPLIALLFAGSLSGIFQIVAPKINQTIIDSLVKGVFETKSLIILALLSGLCLWLATLFIFISEKISFYISTKVEDIWKYTALLKFYNLPMAWLDQHDSGEIGSKLERGGGAIFSILFEIFGQNMLVSFITLFFVMVYSVWYFKWFAIILFLPSPIYILITSVISKKISKMQLKLNKLDYIASRTFYDGIGNTRYVKTFGKEYLETKNFADKWDAYHKFEYSVQRIWLWQSFCQKLIESLTRAALLIAGILAVKNNYLSIGEIVLLLTFQHLTFQPLEKLNQLFTRLKRVTKRASHLFEIYSEPDPLADVKDAKELPQLKNEIQLKEVHFDYSKKIDTLHDINLSIKAGTTTAIVGRSGAGKSTLAMLLMRFYDPTKGEILWNGINLKQAKRSSLRNKMTLILQDTTLFNRSIADNIKYGKPNATHNEIKAAAKLAHADHFIKYLPKGYDSIVGERGVRLSGGQRQRISIARALLVKPEVLIMDEATSHLDTETEVAIKKAIKYLQGKNTQVIIAHRLSTVQHADNIILLDKGRILAQGNHKELLKHPLYRKLCKLQLHK